MGFIAFNIVGACAIIFSAILFWRGLYKPEKIHWEWLFASLVVLFLFCGWVFFLAISGGLGVGLAFFQALFASAAAMLVGLLLALVLRGKHKLFAGVIVFLFPLAIFLSMEIGRINSPELMTEELGKGIAQALNQYYVANGQYPETLEELVPQYVADLKEPTTVWGWLYTVTENGFSIGYVSRVDKWSGYNVCFYTSSASQWECEASSSGRPFDLPIATPGPQVIESTPMR